MAVNGVPKTERIWVRRTISDGSVYYITSKNNDRSYYFLYKMENGRGQLNLGKQSHH